MTTGRYPYFRRYYAGVCFPYDRSDDGGPKPLREALRFVSIASHNLPCRERFAKRFSEGVLLR